MTRTRLGAQLLVLALGAGTIAALAPAAAAVPTSETAETAATATTAVPAGGARAVFYRMSTAQRVGQLFMVGGAATGPGSATYAAISNYHVGSAMLTGRSSLSTSATLLVTRSLQARATTIATLGVPLFVATDQEGGNVQVLRGSGFSRIPTALTQGTWYISTLRSNALTWGRQLRSAGVNLNLAPVLDTVPYAMRDTNKPIGYYDREFGYTTSVVSGHGSAFMSGMLGAHVGTSVKHFPGLGRVTANTDVSAGVTDYVTTYDDPYLGPFRTAVNAGTPFVMMSLADYDKIDPHVPAAFSRKIIGGMLRSDLGFGGVVISDSLAAEQVQAWSPGTRAVNFVNAGGDLILMTDPTQIPAMVNAVLSKANSDSTFLAKVNTAALRVLFAKQRMGLIPRATVTGDYNGDARSDVAFYRPSTGTWYVRGQWSLRYGAAGDIPVPADYRGIRASTPAVFRPSTGTWYVYGVGQFAWGQRGDIPVPADYNGDGRTDIAVYRPSTGTWYVRGLFTVGYGTPGDIPAPADYNGDGRAEISVFRPSTGTWYVRGGSETRMGGSGDRPVAADYDGDGRAEQALFRPSTGYWYVVGMPAVQYGGRGDIPQPADYNGDSRYDVAFFRPSDGSWHVRGQFYLRYGVTGDIPVG
jgi:beta-glucosidase-like glycosyl hydrolase